MEIDKIKEEVLNELKKVDRDGMPDLIKFMEENEFFTSPASSKFHGNNEGGLLVHSYSVYKLLKQKNKMYSLGLSEESEIICGLLHDMCKCGIYKKNGSFYRINDELPIGHGEKSVIMIQKFIKLTHLEILMIRWHMNVFDAGLNNYILQNAIKQYPSLVAMFTADYESSFLLEC